MSLVRAETLYNRSSLTIQANDTSADFQSKFEPQPWKSTHSPPPDQKTNTPIPPTCPVTQCNLSIDVLLIYIHANKKTVRYDGEIKPSRRSHDLKLSRSPCSIIGERYTFPAISCIRTLKPLLGWDSERLVHTCAIWICH